MMGNVSLFLQIVLVFSLWAGELPGCAATADALTARGSTQIPFALVSGTSGVWSGGALLVVQDRFSGAPVFRVFDRNGQQVSQFTFTIPGARLINVYDHSFARAPDGSLAVVGSAYTDDSRATCFLAWVSPDGGQQTVIRTSPFVPRAVTVASDGTIWVAGDDLAKGRESDRNQYLIRHYDKTGKMLRSFVPWSSLATDARVGRPSARSFLVSSKDHIGWYSPLSRTYIEFSLDGGVIKRLKTAEHPKNDLISVALCDDGTLYASTRVLNGGHQTGWGIFALDRDRGEWSFIPQNERWGMLYGCDGTRLASTTDGRNITWLEATGK